jgi:4-hydroxybenzoate polyprenyltransferase
MNDKLTKESSFPLRFKAYLGERFPVVSHGILIMSYFSSNQFLAFTLEHPGKPASYTLNSLIGAIVLFCMFFHLRVFDEHKDYGDDLKFHPGRILQRGLITLRDLRRFGAAAILCELVLSLICGIPATVAATIAILFSALMLKEFFVSGWLKRHFLIYAVSHMLIMPLFALFVFSVTTGKFPWEAPGWFWLYSFVGFFVTFNWEISRKIRVPGDEIEGLKSYSKIFGTYGAAYVVILIRVIDTFMVFLVGWHLNLSPFFYITLIILFLICCVGLWQFRFNTCRRTAKTMEVYAGMYIIAFDLTLAVELIRKNGLEF